MSMIRAVKWVAIFAATAYIALLVLLYVSQETILFGFAPVPDNHEYSFSVPNEEVRLNGEGYSLHGILFKSEPDSSKRLVLYFKGNGGNVGNSESMARTFTDLGFDVLSMDYRGYGKSRGDLSEAAMLDDGLRWYDWATEQAYSDIHVVGWSMGSAFSSHVVANRPVDHLIQFAPFKSVLDMGARTYPFIPEFVSAIVIDYPFRNDLKLASADLQSYTIYHGTGDRVVPFASGKALAQYLGDKVKLFPVEGATHDSIPWEVEVLRDIRSNWAEE